MSISLCIRNKPTKKILNKSGPKIEPCGTTSITTSQSLYELIALVLCFYVTNNHQLTLKMVD